MSRRAALRRAAVREWGPPAAAVRTALAERGARALALTLTATALTALVQLVQNQSWGYGPVRALGPYGRGPVLVGPPADAAVPVRARLDLPVWGALAQILLVFGVAEICLGRWRTLAVAYAATLAGTLYARSASRSAPRRSSGCPPRTREWWTPAPRRRSSPWRCTSAISGGPGSPGAGGGRDGGGGAGQGQPGGARASGRHRRGPGGVRRTGVARAADPRAARAGRRAPATRTGRRPPAPGPDGGGQLRVSARAAAVPGPGRRR